MLRKMYLPFYIRSFHIHGCIWRKGILGHCASPVERWTCILAVLCVASMPKSLHGAASFLVAWWGQREINLVLAGVTKLTSDRREVRNCVEMRPHFFSFLHFIYFLAFCCFSLVSIRPFSCPPDSPPLLTRVTPSPLNPMIQPHSLDLVIVFLLFPLYCSLVLSLFHQFPPFNCPSRLPSSSSALLSPLFLSLCPLLLLLTSAP